MRLSDEITGCGMFRKITPGLTLQGTKISPHKLPCGQAMLLLCITPLSLFQIFLPQPPIKQIIQVKVKEMMLM